MTPQDFAYWLQGFMEISNPENLDETQTQIIKDHLNLVFKKETPDLNNKKDKEWEDMHNKHSWPNNIEWDSSAIISC